jgi:small-conductance mechanosensitive channel
VAADTIRHRFETGDQLDNLTERKILTQLEYLQRIAIVVIGVVAIAFILLQFEGVRSLGQGILASAGITGIIVGLAAQKSIGNLLAGFQIAFTQPIRVDDKLIINGEFGVVEEITLTYVVLKLWDERRLIVPLQYFLDTPFQNWTHTSSNLVGTILLYVDYSFPVDALRQELDRYLETREDWDGKVKSVQLTDITDKVMQVRVLASGKDSGATFGLRCAVREHLMGFIQREHPGSLPKVRTDSPAV